MANVNITTGVRTTQDVGHTTTSFTTILDAVTEGTTEQGKCVSLPRDLAGESTAISLGNRTSKLPDDAPGKTLAELIRGTFVYANVISKFALFYARVSIKIVPRFSPFSVGSTRFAYVPVPLARSPSLFYSNCRFIDVNIAEAEGGMVDCTCPTNQVWFSPIDVIRPGDIDKFSTIYPGTFESIDLYIDDVLGGGFEYYMIFEDLQVAYPYDSVNAQIGDDKLETTSNALGTSRSQFDERPMTKSMPQRTADDMLYDNMSAQVPIYVPLGEFSAAGEIVIDMRDIVYPILIRNQFVELNPFIALLLASRHRFDVHVHLRVVKNNFQNGVFTINYGKATNVLPSAKRDGSLPLLEWNVALQNELEFDIPYASSRNWQQSQDEDRYFIVSNEKAIIPTTGGVGDTVFVYAMITFTNVNIYDIVGVNGRLRAITENVVAQIGTVQGANTDDKRFRHFKNFAKRPQNLVAPDAQLSIGNTISYSTFWHLFVNHGGFATVYLRDAISVLGKTVSTVRNTAGGYEVYPVMSWFDSQQTNIPTTFLNQLDVEFAVVSLDNVAASYFMLPISIRVQTNDTIGDVVMGPAP